MRAHFRHTVLDRSGNAVAGALVTIYEAGTTTPVSASMWDSFAGGMALGNPLASDANGDISFFLDVPQYVDMRISIGGTTRTFSYEAVGPAGAASTSLVVVKMADQENTTTVFVDDDELRFNVAAGHRYTFELTLFLSDTNDASPTAGVTFAATSGVSVSWQDPSDSLDVLIMRPEDFSTFTLTSGGDIVAGSGGHAGKLVGVVEASADGEVVFQFRQDDGNTSGGVTVRAGSMFVVYDPLNILTLALNSLTLTGTVDPSVGAGLAAALNTQYQRTNGTAGELWVKTGPTNFDWTRVV